MKRKQKYALLRELRRVELVAHQKLASRLVAAFGLDSSGTPKVRLKPLPSFSRLEERSWLWEKAERLLSGDRLTYDAFFTLLIGSDEFTGSAWIQVPVAQALAPSGASASLLSSWWVSEWDRVYLAAAEKLFAEGFGATGQRYTLMSLSIPKELRRPWPLAPWETLTPHSFVEPDEGSFRRSHSFTYAVDNLLTGERLREKTFSYQLVMAPEDPAEERVAAVLFDGLLVAPRDLAAYAAAVVAWRGEAWAREAFLENSKQERLDGMVLSRYFSNYSEEKREAARRAFAVVGAYSLPALGKNPAF